VELADAPTPHLPVGTRVFVRDRFLGNWCAGFDVAEVCEGGYRLRRLSDGRVFPDEFAFEDVFLERRRTLREGDDQVVMNRERRQFP
jgi:hypothetical protein